MIDLRDAETTGIAVKPDDKLTLTDLWYAANQDGASDLSVYAEAYVGEQSIGFTKDVSVERGIHPIGDFTPKSFFSGVDPKAWQVQDGWSKLTVVLMLLRAGQVVEREYLRIVLSEGGSLGLMPVVPAAAHPPQLAAERLWYKLNDGPERVVEKDDTIRVVEGNRLCLLRLEYSTADAPSKNDSAHGEATPHKRDYPKDSGWDFSDLQTWEVDRFDLGQNELTEINEQIGDGCWTIGKEWDRLVVHLVHNGEFGYEIDDWFFVWLSPFKDN